MSKYIQISRIRRDGGTQSRAAMDESTIADYVEVVKQGSQFPAVTLYFDGADYWLADGFHRVEAHIRAEVDKVWADVHQGTRRDAVLASVAANANHGLRRTNEDKRRAIMVLLEDPEWSKWADREIARKVGVSPTIIKKYRDEIKATVHDGQTEESTERIFTRGGKTFTMNTGNIGSAEKVPTVADLHKQNRAKVRETEQIESERFLFAYLWTVYPDKKIYIFLDEDANRAYARSNASIKNELLTIKGELTAYAQIEASRENALVAQAGEFFTMPLEESTLYTGDITSQSPKVKIQTSAGYTVPDKKPAPTLDKPQDPPKFEDVTQHEGLKLYYLKPQVLIDIEHNGMWRNAYHMLKKRYAQDAILLCKLSGFGFVAMNEDADTFEKALENVPHEGKRVGLYYLMPDVQQPFYSEILRLTSKKILYFAWVGNDAILFWRDNWNTKATDEQTIPVVDEPAAGQTVATFKEGDDVITPLEGYGIVAKVIGNMVTVTTPTGDVVYVSQALKHVVLKPNTVFAPPDTLSAAQTDSDDTPVYGIGERVIVKTISALKPGTIRYIKNGKYGVFLDDSQSTHYYYEEDLSPELTETEAATLIAEDIVLPVEPAATVETIVDTSYIRPGDTVRTRTNHLGQVESVQGHLAYLKGSSNPHKVSTLTVVSSTIANPPVRYFGGKFRIAEWIIEQFPTHTTYVEPFAGGASVLFRKQPSKIEVLNDLNGEVVNFFDVLRTRPDALIRAIELTPYSREEHRRAHEVTGDELERARRFYVRSRQSYGSGEGEYNTGWRFQANDKRGTTNVEEWNKTDQLWQAATRLKQVQIECDDALNTIKRFDGPNTLFYVDPPYLPETRSTGNEYRHEMTAEQHVELATVLNSVQGMVILSGYKSELYDRMYGDWHCISKETRANDNAPTVEYLWINSAAAALNRLPLFESLGANV